VRGRHGAQNVAQCVACVALTLVVWQYITDLRLSLPSAVKRLKLGVWGFGVQILLRMQLFRGLGFRVALRTKAKAVSVRTAGFKEGFARVFGEWIEAWSGGPRVSHFVFHLSVLGFRFPHFLHVRGA